MNKFQVKFPLLATVLMLSLVTPLSFSAQLFKCKDKDGQTVYSDKDCRPAPRRLTLIPEPSNKKAEVPPAPVEKLTNAIVEQLLRHAIELGEQGDFNGQCALAAPDLAFSTTDRSSSPEIRTTGGRQSICARQREAALELRQNGLTATGTLSKMDIQVSTDGALATASYTIKMRILDGGEAVLQAVCTREDELGLYDGKVLFKRVAAVCTPTQ